MLLAPGEQPTCVKRLGFSSKFDGMLSTGVLSSEFSFSSKCEQFMLLAHGKL